MPDPVPASLPGLPSRDVAFRHLASDAWIAAELAVRGIVRFDRRAASPLREELADAWWRAVAEGPSPSLFREGCAPSPTPPAVGPVAPRAAPPPPIPAMPASPPPPASVATPSRPAPPVREARIGVGSPPQAPTAGFEALPPGVRQLARGLASADRAGAPALKRLIAPHAPTSWPADAEPRAHPAWDVLVVACHRAAPPVRVPDLEPVWRALCAVLAGVRGADAALEIAVRDAHVPATTIATLLDGLPLLRGALVPVARVWEAVDAVTGTLDGPLGRAEAARARALSGASSAPPGVSAGPPRADAPPPSQRWAAHLARLRPTVRDTAARWLDASAGDFPRAATWADALLALRARAELATPMATFPVDAWAVIVEASPHVGATLGPAERAWIAARVDDGGAPGLAERLRDALLGGGNAGVEAALDAAVAALPTSSISGEEGATSAPYGDHARWDGARLGLAWPKHAAWKDPVPPTDRTVRVPFWPARLGGSRTRSFEAQADVALRLLLHLEEACPGALADLQDDLEGARTRGREDEALEGLRAALLDAYAAFDTRYVGDGSFAEDARRELDLVTLDALELDGCA